MVRTSGVSHPPSPRGGEESKTLKTSPLSPWRSGLGSTPEAARTGVRVRLGVGLAGTGISSGRKCACWQLMHGGYM